MKEYIKDTVEHCGFISTDGKYIHKTNTGVKINGRNTCIRDRANFKRIYWHTHPKGRPYFPSDNDIFLPLHYKETEFLFTEFGIWIMWCDNNKRYDRDYILKIANKINGDFFNKKKIISHKNWYDNNTDSKHVESYILELKKQLDITCIFVPIDLS
jgi:hypothetical protein